MQIFFHNDADGRCAGAIAWRSALAGKQTSCVLNEVDYKTPINIQSIRPNEVIIIVDFSFKPEIMEQVLEKTDQVIWLDHHKTAFDYSYSKPLMGIRSLDYSGCELAWEFFFPEVKMPHAVELIGDRDKWAWKYGMESGYFAEGLKIEDYYPTSSLWDTLFGMFNQVEPQYPPYPWGQPSDPTQEKIDKMLANGQVCISYRNSICKEYVKSFGFETEFEGHSCFAMGLASFGTEAFGDKVKEYDIVSSFEFDGKVWTVGMYSETVDVGSICQKHGGGGHTGAGGFTCSELPYRSK